MPAVRSASVFRFRDVRLYIAANLLVETASRLLLTALGWDLYLQTGSALVLGWLGFVQVVPFLLLTLPAGQAADVLDRKRLSAWMLAAMGAGAAALCPLSSRHASVGAYYAVLFLSAVAECFYSPARSALLPRLVPAEEYSNAATWNIGASHAAAVAGPLIAGALLSLPGGAAKAYAAAAVLIFAAAALTAAMRPAPGGAPAEAASFKRLAAGLSFVWNEPVILPAITLDLFAVLFGGATALMPVFAKDILEAGPVGLGCLKAAPELGAIAMGLALVRLPPMRKAGKKLLWVVVGFGAATAAFAFSRNLWLSLALLAFAGACDNVSMVIRSTVVQLRTPDAMRGRVSSVNRMFIGLSNEMGEFESGVTAWWWGAVASVAFGGAAAIATVAATLWLAPALARLDALHEPAAPVPPQGEGPLSV